MVNRLKNKHGAYLRTRRNRKSYSYIEHW
uniref:Uncharacterized protein n=1 Tax=Anguilla anguilla TaxID=7936 RepID=A0A0E9TM96_ANGAN